MEYPSRIVRLVRELVDTGHQILKTNRKWALLREISKEYDVIANAEMSYKHRYREAVPELIVGKM